MLNSHVWPAATTLDITETGPSLHGGKFRVDSLAVDLSFHSERSGETWRVWAQECPLAFYVDERVSVSTAGQLR